MNGLSWLNDLGWPVGRVPNLGAILVALLLVVGAFGIGWFSGSRVGPWVAEWWRNRTGETDNRLAAITCSTIRYGVTAFLLFVAGNASGLSPFALMIIAVALGTATSLFVYHIARGLGVGRVAACILAILTLFAATAGALGGLQPLIIGLADFGFTVGSRHFSLLAVLNFIIVAAVLFLLARVIHRLLAHSIGRLHSLDGSQRLLLQKLAGIGVIVVATLIGVDLLGIDLTALAFFSGAFGLAVGFGLQKTLGNLISGLILLMDRSVKPGDVIVVGDNFGTVNKIGVRAVSVVTRDGKEHLIPNEQLMTEPVENWSYSSRNVRLHIPVGVGYGCDLAMAQRLMVEAATASVRVLHEPRPSVWLRSFGESAVEHEILVWIADPELGVGSVQSDVLNRLWALFSENRIELPYPQRDIHIRSFPPTANS